MTDMKTAATVLQEMMVKLHTMPHYECISQSGPQHQAMFEYRCKAQGIEVTATGRCKKDAKQEVAKLMLRELAAAGYNVPMPYRLDNYQAAQIGKNIPGAGDNVEPASMGSRSYVALLKELCAEYRLPSVEYDLTSDTGPAHQRHFTMVARVGQHSRCATSTTKKAARQLAAEKLYSYLRENLSITKDFDEEDALARAHERVMERYQEAAEDAARRPDLGQRIADYHLGLQTHLGPEALSSGRAALAARAGAEPQSALAAAAAALGLAVQYAELPAQRGPPVAVVALEPAAPAVLLAGADRDAAARAALRYLQHAL